MKIKKLWFNDDYLYVLDEQGKEYRQSLLFYPALQKASDSQRQKYTLSTAGIHWRDINEDVSYESFSYPEPTDYNAFSLLTKK